MKAGNSQVARGYSRSAPQYDKLASHLYLAGLLRLMPRFRVPPMSAILDVGSGTGVNLLAAARKYAPARLLCGIDISPGMVTFANAKATALGVPARFIVGEAEQLPFDDGLFDLVICNSVYHWFTDRRRAVREMHRVLRPGGQIALICAAAPGFSEWFSVIDTILQAALGPAAPKALPEFPTQREIAQVLLESGFLVEHLANPVQLQHITDVKSFVRLMSTVAPHWAADLSDEHAALVEHAAEVLIRRGWPQGFPNTWAAIEAVAMKT